MTKFSHGRISLGSASCSAFYLLQYYRGRSKAWVCGRSFAGIAGSNPAGDMDVSCECCVMSRSGLCVGVITRPEESYRVQCV